MWADFFDVLDQLGRKLPPRFTRDRQGRQYEKIEVTGTIIPGRRQPWVVGEVRWERLGNTYARNAARSKKRGYVPPQIATRFVTVTFEVPANSQHDAIGTVNHWLQQVVPDSRVRDYEIQKGEK